MPFPDAFRPATKSARRRHIMAAGLAGALLNSLVFMPLPAHGQDGPELASVRTLIEQEQYQQAVERLSALQARGDAGWRAYLLLAEAHVGNGAGVAAEAAVDRARKLGADYAGSALVYARSLLVQGQYRAALDAMQGVNLSAEDAVTRQVVRGDALFALGRLDAASDAYETARAADDTRYEPWLGLARIALQSGDLAKADRWATGALERNPDQTMVTYTKGLIARYQGDTNEARDLFEQALSQEESNHLARLELAALMVDAGETGAAQAQLQRVRAAMPNHPMALYLAAVVKARAGDFEDANSLLLRTRGLTDRYLPALYVQGLVSYQIGNHLDAVTRLRRVLSARPGNRPARLTLAAAELKSGQAARALGTIEPLLEGDDPRALAIAASAAMAAGDRERGRAYYDRLPSGAGGTEETVAVERAINQALAAFVAGRPDEARDRLAHLSGGGEGVARSRNIRALGLLASMQLRGGDLEGAADSARRLIAVAPDRALGHNMLGTVFYRQEKFDQAFKEFDQAVDMKSDYDSARRNRALAALALDRFQIAADDLIRLLSGSPGDNRAKALLGRALMGLDRAGEAAGYFGEALRAMPDQTPLRLDYAESLAAAGRTAEAVDQIRRLRREASGNPASLARLGRLLMDIGQPRAASSLFARVVAFDPANGQANLDHGLALYRAGLHTGARQAFGRAEKHLDGRARMEARWLLFASDVAAGRADDALTRLAELDPDSRPEDVSRALVGRAYLAGGQPEKAVDHLEGAIARADGPRLRRTLADAHMALGRAEAARETLEAYLKAGGEDRELRVHLAELYEQADQHRDAARHYFAILQKGVADARLTAKLARAYLEIGDRDSVPLAERAYLMLPDDPFILDTYGWVKLQAARDVETALPALEKAARRAPSDPLVRYHLGMAYLADGQRDAGRAALSQALSLDPDFADADVARRQLIQLSDD
ncbi:XrtA/PEP-CTERM system TPR-repeat protein PrsT [Yunchengibacter salinarum]|uniref:XrtA/PEP-CTERM system TPR-repeat protein PrsT n=1 Tax=Yunchengibacter salinarum TaxID=3133399 RepID=UPI0035B5D8CF